MVTPGIQSPLNWMGGILHVKPSVLLMFLCIALTFVTALYYVEQQLRLRNLNYDIIALKQQQKQLLEQQKTLQLQLDQAKRLEKIEDDMKRLGFVPVAESQIRIVQ